MSYNVEFCRNVSNSTKKLAPIEYRASLCNIYLKYLYIFINYYSNSSSNSHH